MLEELKKKGKPISPKMQQMADWLDSLEAGQAAGGQPGEVRTAHAKGLVRARTSAWQPPSPVYSQRHQYSGTELVVSLHANERQGCRMQVHCCGSLPEHATRQ